MVAQLYFKGHIDFFLHTIIILYHWAKKIKVREKGMEATRGGQMGRTSPRHDTVGRPRHGMTCTIHRPSEHGTSSARPDMTTEERR